MVLFPMGGTILPHWAYVSVWAGTWVAQPVPARCHSPPGPHRGQDIYTCPTFPTDHTQRHGRPHGRAFEHVGVCAFQHANVHTCWWFERPSRYCVSQQLNRAFNARCLVPCSSPVALWHVPVVVASAPFRFPFGHPFGTHGAGQFCSNTFPTAAAPLAAWSPILSAVFWDNALRGRCYHLHSG